MNRSNMHEHAAIMMVPNLKSMQQQHFLLKFFQIWQYNKKEEEEK